MKQSENDSQPTPAEEEEQSQDTPAQEPTNGQPPTGDRALDRLHQFEKERGLEESDVEHPECDQASLEEAIAPTPDTP
jgi:hypothetical protein